MIELKIEFPNQETASEFASWLCNSGEQSYYDWCDCGGKPHVIFQYHHPQNEEFPRNDKRRYEKAVFCNGNVIKTELAEDE